MRAPAIDAEAPDCACEKYRMSGQSPCPVGDEESIARFIFSPMHVGKNGALKPSIFSHVRAEGCSVQRESIASVGEILNFVKSFLLGKDDRSWIGVLLASCKSLRAIKADNEKRAICVYDTGTSGNPAHGELCQTRHVEEADDAELRHDLFTCFGNGTVVDPTQYRDGVVWLQLPTVLQARPIASRS